MRAFIVLWVLLFKCFFREFIFLGRRRDPPRFSGLLIDFLDLMIDFSGLLIDFSGLLIDFSRLPTNELGGLGNPMTLRISVVRASGVIGVSLTVALLYAYSII